MKHSCHPTAALVLFAALALPVSRAHACSVPKVDSADDLVEQADAIYLVVARDYIQSTTGGIHPTGTVRFSISETLKGIERKEIRAEGFFTNADDPNDLPVPYHFVRPGGRHGNCYAESYREGRAYLLFIKNSTPYWSPLAPVNEQVTSESDSWVQWVKQHLKFSETLKSR